MRKHLLRCLENQKLEPFPIYRTDIQNHSTRMENNTPADWKMPRRSARLAKRESTLPTPTSNQFQLLIEDEVQDDHRPAAEQNPIVTKVPSGTEEETEDIQVSSNSIQSRLHSSSLIANLTDVLLSETETMVLKKGLNFSTVEQRADKISLLDDTYQFLRKVKLRAHFDSTDDADASPTNKANNTEADQVSR